MASEALSIRYDWLARGIRISKLSKHNQSYQLLHTQMTTFYCSFRFIRFYFHRLHFARSTAFTPHLPNITEQTFFHFASCSQINLAWLQIRPLLSFVLFHIVV